MKISIIIHNGDAKTGTSIIQNFLDVNRMILFKNHSCLYPNFLSPNNLAKGRCHNHAVWYNKIKENRQKFDNEISNLLDFANKHSIEKVILSNEAWFLQKDAIKNLQNIAKQGDQIELKTISYLRRIDYWCESAWKQWGLKVYDSINEYSKLNLIQGRFKGILKHLENWGEVIGVENVIVRPYEKQQLTNNLVYDFISSIGINYNSSDWRETETKNLAINRGFNRDVLEVLHCCQDLFSSVHDNHLFDVFSDLLSENFSKKPFEKYDLLSPKQRLDIISKNAPYEKQIAEKFLGRKDGRLFFDPTPQPDDEWQPYEGLNLEKTLPIIINLIDGIYQKQVEIQRNSIKPSVKK